MSGRARDGQKTADLLRPAAHRLETEVTGATRSRVEAAPVVADLDDHSSRTPFDPNPGPARVRVLENVGKRLSSDSEELGLGAGAERQGAGRAPNVDGRPVVAGESR